MMTTMGTSKTMLLGTIAALSILSGTAEAADCEIRNAGNVDFGHNGLATFFCGVIDGVPVIAGGTDFEGVGPWDGGIKSWYNDIYTLKEVDGEWKTARQNTVLPISLGNGCSACDGKALYCFGGRNGERESRAVYRIASNAGGQFVVDSIAAIPEDFSACAALYRQGRIFVHGTSGDNNLLYEFTPGKNAWRGLEGCPGRPIEEGACLVYQHNGREEALYLIGGRGNDRDGLHIVSSIYEYLPAHNRWEELRPEGLGELMYASAVKYGSAHILIIGGDDGVEFRKRLRLDDEIKACADQALKDSLEVELRNAFVCHPGFSRKIYAYHTITNTLTLIGEADEGLPACTSALGLGDRILLVSGEAGPGRRSSDIIELKVNDNVSFGALNYIVIILYLAGMLFIGFYFSRKARNTDEFFKGGSRIPWWAAGISIFATALSAITFLSIPAKAYMADWGMFMFNMAIILIVPVVIHFYLPFFRKLNVVSAYQYLEDRFSPSVRYLASAFFCLFMFARVAIVLFLPSLALNAVTGLNVYLCILLMGIVTIIYCTLGGIEAVVWGDVIQGIILVGGALVCLVYLLTGVEGGIGEVFRIAVDDRKFRILDFSLDWTRPVFWVTVIGGFANQLLTYTSDQSVVQRYLTVKDTKGTEKGLWLNGILSIPITLVFFSIGTGLYVFFKTHPDLLNVSMNNTDSIFPHFMMCKLPSGVAGLLIAAVFAAAMSTLSANINSTSTVMTEDFFARLRKNSDENAKMRFAKWTGVLLGGFGIVMAILLATFDIASLWDQFNFFLGLLTSGVGGLFLMGIFTKRIGTRSALTGFVCSIVALLLFHRFSHVSVILYGFLGLVSCFAGGYVSSFIFGEGR